MRKHIELLHNGGKGDVDRTRAYFSFPWYNGEWSQPFVAALLRY